jgi:inner membrane protein
MVLAALILLLFPQANGKHLWGWTFLAVFIHIFIDIFNTYGTQALKPISDRWISLDLINIFDPFIFAVHLFGFVLWWLFPEHAGKIFLTIYLLIALYILWRARIHARLLKWVKEQVKQEGRYTLVPTFRFQVWNVLLEQENQVLMGEIKSGRLNWTGRLSTEYFHHPATQLSKQAEAIDAFLSFTSYGYPQVIEHPFGYEVRWLDVRYHHKKHFPFVAVALISHDGKILHSFVGWMSEEHLEKKIQYLTS